MLQVVSSLSLEACKRSWISPSRGVLKALA